MVSLQGASHGVLPTYTGDIKRVGSSLDTMLQARRQHLQQNYLLHNAIQPSQDGDSQTHVSGEEYVHTRQLGDDTRGVT